VLAGGPIAADGTESGQSSAVVGAVAVVAVADVAVGRTGTGAG
jgi:hypothetical protein